MSTIFATELSWENSLAQIEDKSVNLCLSDLPYPTTERYRRVGTTTRTKKSVASSNAWYPVMSIAELCEFLAALYPKMAQDSYAFLYVDRDTELLLQTALGVAAKLREITDRMTSNPDATGFSGAIKDRIGWGWRNSTDVFTGSRPPKKWQEDEPFCAWLVEQEYAKPQEGAPSPCVAEGSIIYWWEAWRACAEHFFGREGEGPDVFRWVKTTNDGERLRPGTGYHGVRCTEQILCLTKGKPKPRKGERWNNALFAPRPRLLNESGEVIKTASPKSVSIARKLIRAGSDVGQVVYDPFVGCGTHAEAILAEKRVGIVNDVDLSTFYSNMRSLAVRQPEEAKTWRLVSL